MTNHTLTRLLFYSLWRPMNDPCPPNFDKHFNVIHILIACVFRLRGYCFLRRHSMLKNDCILACLNFQNCLKSYVPYCFPTILLCLSKIMCKPRVYLIDWSCFLLQAQSQKHRPVLRRAVRAFSVVQMASAFRPTSCAICKKTATGERTSSRVVVSIVFILFPVPISWSTL